MTLEAKQTFCTVIVDVLTVAIVIIPFTGKVTTQSKKIYKKIAIRGWIIITSTILTFYFNEKKESLSGLEQDKKDSISTATLLKANENARIFLTDKLIEANKGNDVRYNNIITSLAKYNFTYDSNTHALIKLVRDSAKKVTKQIIKTAPSFSIAKIETIEKSPIYLKLKISFVNQGSTARNIDCKTYYMVKINGNFEITKTINRYIFPLHSNLPPGYTFNPNLELVGANIEEVAILASGAYEDDDGNSYPIELLYSFEVNNSQFGMYSGYESQRIRALFNKAYNLKLKVD